MRSPASLAVVAATAAAALLSVSPAVAATRSAIVYAGGDGNVWQVQPDGKGAHAVSADGTKAKPYARPRLAPDGTIWALRGSAVVHLAPSGQKLASFTPAPPKDSEGVPTIDEPEFFDVSPDGTKLAYGVDNIRCEDDGHCNTDGVTAILDTSGRTLSQDTRFGDASFLSNTRLIGSDGLAEGEVRLLGLTGASRLWYVDGQDVHPENNGWTREPAMSPDGTQLAAQRTVTGHGNYVITYKVPAGPAPIGFGVPQPMCLIDGIVARGGSPAWSPDGKQLVVAATDGLIRFDLSQVVKDTDCPKATATVLAPAGATQGDWGTIPVPDPPVQEPPAEQPPAQQPATPAQPGPTTTQQQQQPQGGGAPPVAATATLTVPAQRLKTILRSGLKVQVAGVAPGRLPITVALKGKVVGRVTATVPPSGRLHTRITLTKATARRLAKARSATLRVRAGGVTQTLRARR